MKLKEIFDKPARVQWYKGTHELEGRFQIDNEEYAIEIEESRGIYKPGKGGDGVWKIAFYKKTHSPQGYKWDYEKTGSGNEIQVFSTVVNAIIDWATSKQYGDRIKEVHFTAKEPSRQKMYNTLAKKMADALGFTVKKSGKKFIVAN